jgi:subfamily B ATP-binding cassette protein MsbA
MVQLVLRSVSYFRADLKLIVVLFAMIGASVGLNLLYAWPMAILIDSVLSPTTKDNWIHHLFLAPFGDNRMWQVVGLALTGMAIKILQDGVWGIRTLLNSRIRLNGTTRVKNSLFGKFQELELGWHRSRSQGDTIYRLGMDSNGPWGILDTLVGSGASMVTLVAMTFIMLSRSVPLTLVALSITPVLIIANVYFQHAIRHCAATIKTTEAALTTVVQRAVNAIGLIQSFGRQRSEGRRFSNSVKENRQNLLRP